MLDRRYNLSYKQAGTFIAFIVLAVFVIRFLNTQKNEFKPANNNGFEIGLCRTCEVIKDKDLIIDEDRGEYLDSTLIKKLEILAGENKDWRITEAYPPTVQHISFCHQNGTCADIAIDNRDKYSKGELIQGIKILCTAAKKAGLNVLNEYYEFTAKELAGDTGSNCGVPAKTDYSTVGHLHVR